MITIRTKNYIIEAEGKSVIKRLAIATLLSAVFLFFTWGPVSERDLKEQSEKISGVIKKFECEDIFGKVGHQYSFNSQSGHQFNWRTGGMRVACDNVESLVGKKFVAHVRYQGRPIEIIVEGKPVLPISEYSGRMKFMYPFWCLGIFVLVFMWYPPSYTTITERGEENA